MLTQNIQVLGERNPKDKLNNIDLTRSVRLNDLTQEEMAKLYRRGQTDVTKGSLNQGFKFDYLFDGNAYIVSLDVVAITFDSETQAVVFDCGYSTVYNRYFRVLLTKGTDGTYSWSQRITAPTWVDESDLKTINGESIVGEGNIEIAAGVESLNGQKGALTLKTVNGNDMLGEGNVTIDTGVESLNGQKGSISLKTVNGNELIGTGDIEIKGGGDATPTGTTLYFTTTDGQTLNANIEAKNKAGTVIEPSLKTPTAWYYDEIVETIGFPSKTTNCNLYSLNGVNIPVRKVINKDYPLSKISFIMENCRYADLRKFFFEGYNRELSGMFWGSGNLEWVDIPYLNIYNTTKMDKMFYDCSGLTYLDASNWNTSQVTDMSDMFWGCRSLTTLNLSNWDTSNVTNMDGLFGVCEALTQLDVSHFNTSKVTNMGNMFRGCSSLTSLDVSNLDTSNVTKMYSMFSFCSKLTTLDLSHFNTSNVTNMSAMFDRSNKLTTLDLSHFNTSNVTNMSEMFNQCERLTSLDLSNWDLTKVTNMDTMFWMDYALKTIIMKNCSTETVDKIRAALPKDILSNVQIITA